MGRGPDNITQGSRSAEIMCDKFKEMGIDKEARIVQISGQPGYNPRYDVDGDQTITIVDVQTFAAQWGWPSLAQQP